MRRYLILLGVVAILTSSPRASGQSADDPFVGEIIIVAFNFEPPGWAFCDGRLMAISQDTALFALLGTTYGGDGQTTFALPDLRGRVPIHQGQGNGPSNYVMGQTGGEETVTLTINQIPAHNHSIAGESSVGSTNNPAGGIWASQSHLNVYSSSFGNTAMNPGSVSTAGGSQPHDNRSPYLALNYIISLFGIFPSQN
jgi:microcystin-dependent protein